MNFNFFNYLEHNEMSFTANPNDFITFLGDKNNTIVENIMFKKQNDYIKINNEKITNKTKDKLRSLVEFSCFEMINTFLAETLRDELAYGLESFSIPKHEMNVRIESISIMFGLNKLLDKSPQSLSTSAKIKLSLARSLVTKPKILVIKDILSLLDENDTAKVYKALKQYTKNNGIILNFTTNIEETLLGSSIIITDKEKILLSGPTLSVLNEEKIMKRLGYNLPFIVQLNKYLMDYELIDNYIIDYEGLVGAIWK